jgi:hypothetical protein
LAISVAGRLSEKNPAYVLPALRRYLIQLLTYLDQRFKPHMFDVFDNKCGFQSYIILLQHFAHESLSFAVWIASVERKVLDYWVV